MKALFSFVLACCTCFATAQPTLTGATTNPQAGESFITHRVASPYPGEGSSGANITWDFHTLTSATADTTYFVTCSSTPECDFFAGSDLGIPVGPNGYEYITANATKLSANGYYSLSSPSDTTIITGQTALQYPFMYNSTFAENYTQQAVSSSGQFAQYNFGPRTVTCDAYGTLITPISTFTNVLRIHTFQSETDSEIANGHANVAHSTHDSYTWYAPGFHDPLLTVEYYTILGNNPFTDTSVNYTTQLDHAVGVATVNNHALGLELYPNPAKETIKIKFTLPEKEMVAISVLDMLGREVGPPEKRIYDAGEHEEIYNTTALSKGLYFVHMNCTTGSITKKIEVL